HELLSRLAQISDEKPVELYQEKLFCTTLTDCLRAAHKITLTGIRIVMNGAIDVLYAVPGSQVTEVPSWAPQFIRNVGPYLVLRAVVLAAIAFALYRYFRRWWTVALVANVLLWWSTGVPIRAMVKAYGWLTSQLGNATLGSILDYHFSMNSTIFLVEYDYLALTLLLLFPLWLQQHRIHQGVWRPLLLGALLGMTFEHLAPVYVVALVWLAWRKRLTNWFRPALLVGVGWVIYIAGMIIYTRLTVPGAEERIVSITQLGYRINREGNHEWIIFRFVFGFLGVPYLLGLALGAITRRLGLLRTAAADLRPYIHAVLLGLCLSYLVGFFHSALITEFGRQTIAAQVLLFAGGVLRFAPRPSSPVAAVPVAR
ncbi:MAG: hypothetical protein EBW14_20825, partial [Oxalobacteraceae bacterium]|nr:hypothetical protein [Oxalobacteraceae bacterium]